VEVPVAQRPRNPGGFLKKILKEVAWGGERTRVLSISFIFSFSTTLPLSHSGSPNYYYY
jgi:hypothetical protein